MDVSILDKKINDTTTLRDASSIQFIQWLLKKVNESGISNSYTIELNMLASGYPGSIMSIEDKLDKLSKLEKAGISF